MALCGWKVHSGAVLKIVADGYSGGDNLGDYGLRLLDSGRLAWVLDALIAGLFMTVNASGWATKRRMGKWIHVVVEGGGVGSQYAIGALG